MDTLPLQRCLCKGGVGTACSGHCVWGGELRGVRLSCLTLRLSVWGWAGTAGTWGRCHQCRRELVPLLLRSHCQGIPGATAIWHHAEGKHFCPEPGSAAQQEPGGQPGKLGGCSAGSGHPHTVPALQSARAAAALAMWVYLGACRPSRRAVRWS